MTERQCSLDALMADLRAPLTDNHDKSQLDVPANGVTALKWINDKHQLVLFMDQLLADQETGYLTSAELQAYADKREMFPTYAAIELVAIHIFREDKKAYFQAKRCFNYTHYCIRLWDVQCMASSDQMLDRIDDLQVERYRSWDPASLEVDNDDPCSCTVETASGHGKRLALEECTQG